MTFNLKSTLGKVEMTPFSNLLKVGAQEVSEAETRDEHPIPIKTDFIFSGMNQNLPRGESLHQEVSASFGGEHSQEQLLNMSGTIGTTSSPYKLDMNTLTKQQLAEQLQMGAGLQE